MKSWRTITAATLVAAAPASAVFAGGKCAPDLSLASVFPLVMCVERTNNTSTSLGNGFPWENDTTFFAAYRNQFLYPSSTVLAVAATAATIETMQARAVTFSGASTNVYGSALPDNFIRVGTASSKSLVKTFSANTNVAHFYYANFVGPKTVQHSPGAKGSSLSDCVAGCSPGADMLSRNSLTIPIDFRTEDPATLNILVDTLQRTTAGNSGNGIWDVTDPAWGGCSGPTRAYGSGSFVNSNALTTAFGVDAMAFVWVFQGKALPPPATVQQQVAEIIRLLITPEGLRCSGIDLTVNKKLDDDALNFPDGKDYDPIPPRIGNGGVKTGEELDNNRRAPGWQHP